MKKKVAINLFSLVLIFALIFSGCSLIDNSTGGKSFSLSDIPDFSNSPYVVINDNNPFFEDSELTEISFENYSELDYLGRCGVTYACIGTDIMPTEERGNIGSV